MSVGVEISLFGVQKSEQTINKRNKGKSLIELPDSYTLIDIETTGLSSMYDEIIELSAIKVRENKIVNTFSSLIKPKYRIDGFITELTGITNEMVQNAPRIKSIIQDYINFISDDIVIGYNINFDINFIYDNYLECKKLEFNNNFIDLMRICRKLCLLQNHKLKTVAEYYNISTDGHHRGLTDCNITFEIYNAVKNEILSKYTCANEFYKNNWLTEKKAKDIITSNKDFDTSHIFYNKVCAFTGTLSKLPRKDAMQKVVDIGGICGDNLTKETNFLIVGEQDYSRTVQNGKSRKILKAEEYILKGFDIKIIPEYLFYELIEN